MYLPINLMPNQSRVWIMISLNPLDDGTVTAVHSEIIKFFDNWQTHGRDVQASLEIIDNQAIIVAADESSFKISGCGIDSLVAAIASIDNRFKTSFSGNNKTLVRKNGQAPEAYTFNKLIEALQNGEILPTDELLNHLAVTLASFFSNPYIKVADSWAQKFLPQVST